MDEEKKKISLIDDDMGKHPDKFYNLKSLLEEEAGFKGKPVGSIEDKLKLFEHYHNPEHKFAERFQRGIDILVRGGHPTHEKGAKYHALNELYKILDKDTAKLEREEDVRKVLTPFMDEFLRHTTYEHWKELEDDLKKGKADGSKYTDEEIFNLKATLFDRMIAAGAGMGRGQKVKSIHEAMAEMRGKQRVEIEEFIDELSNHTVAGYAGHMHNRLMNNYFRLEDSPAIKKYFVGELEKRGLQPKETIAHLDHNQLLDKYGKLLSKEAEEEYVPLKKEGK
ncbi:MAG TPA: hypothetical protein VJ461_05365 [Candidatus Nanoarchaeia archaeon]|nr:hypothetical protein [Candidatus Nanoarchaeia archaeon]